MKRSRRSVNASHAQAHLNRDLFVQRTGVRLLFGDAQFRQEIEDDVRLDLKLARKLVNANFTHMAAP
jgi:hypothetical protein